MLPDEGRIIAVLRPSIPASSIAPAGRRSQSGVHGPADSSRFWPTEHCTSYLPTSSCLGDQPPVSETATVIPARGATGLSMAIIAAPAFSSGMRSAISSPRSSRPSVIIASMAG